ncbi:unnamed protein product [Rhizoctonia solani]|uniref:Intradiol ring-cleavage dioxygenases domain-containing protein n=1 Tax=Rhizoctonia solani TaxID=456999 RepID=A0A8H2XY98_9AGAM|nr:unnamed protein product [Rhizoctonia solani]
MFTKAVALSSLFAASLQLVAAHPGEAHIPLPLAELQRRQLEAGRRHNVARNCAPQIAEFNARRKAKRGIQANRCDFNGGRFESRQDDTAASNTPTYSTIQNSTCVTAPEVTEGPYYVANGLLRMDLRENQAGVDLVLDIGVMDTTTCTPLDNALVEIWACNATGAYSGFTTATLEIPDGTRGGPMQSTAMSDQYTWLRGGYAINSEGMMEFKTIYPGYSTNGSIVSHAGQVRHIGQLFFDEDLNTQVLAQPAYLDTTQTRTVNDDDDILATENADGYNAFAASWALMFLKGFWRILVTLGVDTSFQGSIVSTNYVTPSADSNVASATAA